MHYIRMRKYGSLEPKILKNGPRMKYPEEYKSWASMRDRCLSGKHQHYDIYKNVKICKRWLELPNGFANFMEDMGPKPSYERTASGAMPLYSLDRIDVNGDYTPENCRWATWTEQESNRHDSTATPGVRKQHRLWVATHRTKAVTIRGSFPTKEIAIEAKQDWTKKYPS